MIRNEQEYQAAVEKLAAEEKMLRKHRRQLKQEGLTPAQIKRAMDPLISFSLQLREEVEYYEKLKQGVFPELDNFSGLGQLLVALRIANNLSQKDLADRLGVDKSQISRDERNEYHGITIERAQRVLESLGVHLVTQVEDRPSDGRRMDKNEPVPA